MTRSGQLKRIAFGMWRSLAGAMRASARANMRRLRARGESPASLVIREAVPGDIPALAHLHVATWNATYAPLLMKGPGPGIREAQWREAFARRDAAWCCFVVERPDGALVGFVQGRRSDHPDYAGELGKIYLRSEYQRLGLGKRLLGRVARHFLAHGIESMWLYGDARNPSSAAWVAMGAIRLDDDPGSGNYAWRDLTALAACSGLDEGVTR